MRLDCDPVQIAIKRLQAFEPPEGYWLAFSGGKDSCVIKRLADMAGVKYEAHYNVTSVDPPELVRFIRRSYPDVIFDMPELSMWQLIVRKMMPPTRFMRYCCAELKEHSGCGHVVVTGVRWAESARRQKLYGIAKVCRKNEDKSIILNDENDESRRLVENCYRTEKTLVNPIVDWSDDDVWDFIRKYNVPYCGLYDEGWKRLGCIGCPMAGTKRREKEFERYPKIRAAYIRAFDRMLEARKAAGKDTKWKTGQEVFDWWIRG